MADNIVTSAVFDVHVSDEKRTKPATALQFAHAKINKANHCKVIGFISIQVLETDSKKPSLSTGLCAYILGCGDRI